LTAKTNVDLRIPTPLRAYTDRQSSVRLSGSTVDEAMTDLITQHPDLRQHLFSEDGTLRSYVNLYLNAEDIRHLDGAQTPLSPGDKLSLIPAVAGGGPGG
jgi:molybdopterin converting factor small subunit